MINSEDRQGHSVILKSQGREGNLHYRLPVTFVCSLKATRQICLFIIGYQSNLFVHYRLPVTFVGSLQATTYIILFIIGYQSHFFTQVSNPFCLFIIQAISHICLFIIQATSHIFLFPLSYQSHFCPLQATSLIYLFPLAYQSHKPLQPSYHCTSHIPPLHFFFLILFCFSLDERGDILYSPSIPFQPPKIRYLQEASVSSLSLTDSALLGTGHAPFLGQQGNRFGR